MKRVGQENIFRRIPAFWWLAVTSALLGCSGGGSAGGPVAPEPPRAVVNGQRATFDGLSVTLTATGDGWTSDNQFVEPDPGTRFYTVEVLYNNQSARMRTANPFQFRIRLPDQSLVDPEPGWREPPLTDTTLNPGDQVRGWITFQVPVGVNPTHLVWSARFDVSAAIPIP